MNIVLPFLLSIVIFPFIWVFYYLLRIVWGDFLAPLIDLFMKLGAAIISIFSSPTLFFVSFGIFLRDLMIFPIALIIDIPVGLVETFVSAAKSCSEFLEGIFGED